MKGMITPGRPIVKRISALAGTVGERILDEIAHPATQPLRHRRDFGPWVKTWGLDGHETCRGLVIVRDLRIPITLEKCDRVKEAFHLPLTLLLEEVRGWRLSLKPLANEKGVLILPVGDELAGERLKKFATQVVATFVVHGFGWRNRRGEVFAEPYGEREGRLAKRSPIF
jgi:hypothetical protein